MKRKPLRLVVVAAAIAGAGYCVSLKINYLDKEARHALENAPEVVLYSLHPYPYEIKNGQAVPLADDVPKFHEYRILGQTSLPSGDTRKAAVDAVNDAVNKAERAWTLSVGGCFKPRHGIRATDESGVYDLVICFQCRQLILHLPDGTQKYFLIDGSGAELNRILETANVPLPTE
jgi:hypothetical protein